MLHNAPKFYEVAKRIVEITEGCIIVAHNSSFDYRILKTEFNRLGYTFKRKTLCTVELSKELIPDQPSYSLGKLTRSLGIAISDRHRADGDAKATVKLFKMLLNKDLKKEIITQAVKTEQKSKMTSNLRTIIEKMPTETGVYYIHNETGDIIYIGKSNNIKKRITQHFTGTNSKSKKIQTLASCFFSSRLFSYDLPSNFKGSRVAVFKRAQATHGLSNMKKKNISKCGRLISKASTII